MSKCTLDIFPPKTTRIDGTLQFFGSTTLICITYLLDFTVPYDTILSDTVVLYIGNCTELHDHTAWTGGSVVGYCGC